MKLDEYVVRDLPLSKVNIHDVPDESKEVALAHFEMLEAFANRGSTSLSFRHRLFLTIAHGDTQAIERIAMGFPLEAAVYQSFRTGDPVSVYLGRYRGP